MPAQPPELTEAQLDGTACRTCAAPAYPLLPAGTVTTPAGVDLVRVHEVAECRSCRESGR
ncbi:MAG: hypothetical protein HOZ81_50490 [Streptomyces sp.]|nr:hypothetical protein [Streptomyces sp.]NUS24404.1 hypothetical protein [Streptomyces sp.]